MRFRARETCAHGRRWRRPAGFWLAVLAILAWASLSTAHSFEHDGHRDLDHDEEDGDELEWELHAGDAEIELELEGDDSGFEDWEIDGEEFLEREWFWFRVGDSKHEKPLDALELLHHSDSGDDEDEEDEPVSSVELVFGRKDRFKVTLRAELFGEGPDALSSLIEEICIENLSGETLSFHLFEFTNFELPSLGGEDDDEDEEEIEFAPGQVIHRGGGFAAVKSFSRTPDGRLAGDPDELEELLEDDEPDALSPTAPGAAGEELAWILQWDLEIEPYGKEHLRQTKAIVPEPRSGDLVGIGLLLLAAGRHAWRSRAERGRQAESAL